ncbi:VOC family protein [Pseudoroseicyclus sp. H15]
MPVLDAVGVFAHDLSESTAFYELLGFVFPDEPMSERHVEGSLPGGEVRVMIDTIELIESLLGEPPRAGNASVFALRCETPAEVDSLVARIGAAGQTVKVPAWDAPWDQRYATVEDPAGHRIDLYAPL